MVSKQPPWSMATSTSTEPGRIRRTIARRDQLRRRRARDQHRADHQVGLSTASLDRVGGGVERVRPARRTASSSRSRGIERSMHGHLRPHARPPFARRSCRPRRRRARRPAPAARRARRRAACPAALLLLQAVRADLHRHAAGDLAHRRQQRQPAVRVGHGLVGDASRRTSISPSACAGSAARCR